MRVVQNFCHVNSNSTTPYCWVINDQPLIYMMDVRDLLYCRLWWVWETCNTVSLFFWRPVLFCLSIPFCHNMMGVIDLLYCRVWWVRETCHTMSFFFRRWVLFVCLRSLYWPLCFYSIVLFAISSLNIYVYI